jgi:hypothetical protein
MALSKIDAANFLTGTIPQGNVANASLGAVTALPGAIATGKVLQVITSENGYGQSTTSTSMVNIESSSGTAWETAITPSATSSKIIVMANILMTWEQNGNAQNRGKIFLLSKTGSGSYSDNQGGELGNYDYGGSGVQSRQRVAMTFELSPSTTSAVTVKFQYKGLGGTSCNVNDGSLHTSTVFLWEESA